MGSASAADHERLTFDMVVSAGNVVSPIRRLCPRTNLIMREVEGIDLKKQIVTISPGFRPRQLQLRYEHLVIAVGKVTDFQGMPGVMESEVTLTREATMNSSGFTCMVKYEASVWANFRLDAPHVV